GAADGILRISNENMANAIRRMTVHKGLDPREFSLIGFGGAGPMHAVELARELQMSEVIVPLSPGATSALGLLFADARHDLVRSLIVSEGELDAVEVERLYAEMEEQARALLREEGFADDAIRLERQIDLRYVSQVRTLTIPLPRGRAFADAVTQFH